VEVIWNGDVEIEQIAWINSVARDPKAGDGIAGAHSDVVEVVGRGDRSCRNATALRLDPMGAFEIIVGVSWRGGGATDRSENTRHLKSPAEWTRSHNLET